jgi:hypothetical protein
MSAAKLIEMADVAPDPVDADADRDRALALDVISNMQAIIAALQADNWRLISEKAARSAPPQVWLPLKRAAADVTEPYENVRKWCELGVIVAEKRGWGRGRWYVEMGSLRAHVAPMRGI